MTSGEPWFRPGLPESTRSREWYETPAPTGKRSWSEFRGFPGILEGIPNHTEKLPEFYALGVFVFPVRPNSEPIPQEGGFWLTKV